MGGGAPMAAPPAPVHGFKDFVAETKARLQPPPVANPTGTTDPNTLAGYLASRRTEKRPKAQSSYGGGSEAMN